MNALGTARAKSKPARGLVDFIGAALCLWAAAYHTPVGALARTAGAFVMGKHSTARPLLAYYSAGVYDASPTTATPTSLPQPPKPPANAGPLPPETALGYGAWAAFHTLPVSQQAIVLAAADAHGLARARVEDVKEGPVAMGKLLGAMEQDAGGPDAALAALFCGTEPARFAVERARAEHRTPDLATLAGELPPGHDDGIAAASQAAELGTAYALAWPVPDSTRITSPFGMRLHPILGVRKMHTGVDLGVPEGTSVHASAAGIVRRVSEDAVNGRVVIVDHGRGVTTAYCHNSELLVHVGDHVERGTLLARSGSTGRSTGPHLHYQLDLGGTPVDPLGFRVEHANIDPNGLALGGD